MSGIFVDIAKKQPIAQPCDQKCDFCRPGIQGSSNKKGHPLSEVAPQYASGVLCLAHPQMLPRLNSSSIHDAAGVPAN